MSPDQIISVDSKKGKAVVTEGVPTARSPTTDMTGLEQTGMTRNEQTAATFTTTGGMSSFRAAQPRQTQDGGNLTNFTADTGSEISGSVGLSCTNQSLSFNHKKASLI
jgi:hypothetical protein